MNRMFVFLHPAQMANQDLVRCFSSDPNVKVVEVKPIEKELLKTPAVGKPKPTVSYFGHIKEKTDANDFTQE